MVIEKNIRVTADTSDAEKNIDNLAESIENVGDTAKDTSKDVKSVGKSAESSKKGFKSMAGGMKLVGGALKALGIGIFIALIAKMGEVFSRNQKVIDFFGTAMETLSIVFNDLFDLIADNFQPLVDFMKEIFENPLENIKKFGQLVKENIIERFESALEVAGYLGTALKKLFEGDFKGALDSVKAAGIEMVDVFIGVDDAASKIAKGINNIVEAGSEYLKQTVDQAKANVNLANSAQLAAAQQGRLVEQYDRLAEKQRQIRDDESKPIKERQEANDKLLEVLEMQEKAMIAQADLQVAYASSLVATNNNIENQVALTEALANKEGVLAAVEGFRSEQIVNRIALKKEEIELNNSISDAEKERRLAQLEFEESQEETELGKLEKQRERLEEENEIILEDLERKKELYALGTQARVDAEQDYLTRKQEIDNALEENATKTAEEISKIDIEWADLTAEAKLAIASAALTSAASLVDENSVAGKGIAIAQTGINTAQGIMQAFATLPTIAAIPAAALVGAAGIAQTLKIAKTKVPSATGSGFVGGGSGGGGGRVQAPSFNLVQGSASNQIANSVQTGTEPVRSFVVSSDITSNQELDRRIEDGSTL